jgi:RNA polymerase sigma-70 factor (ECF subfamily)
MEGTDRDKDAETTAAAIQAGATADECSLAERILLGDRSAENELVRRYFGHVLAMASARMRDHEAAREVADDVMMATVTALRAGSVRDVTRLAGFVHGTTVNLIKNRLRSLARVPRMEVMDEELPTADATGSLERDIELDQLRWCLGKLSETDRGILSMSLLEGLKPGEIADRIGSSPEAVRQQKSRALKRVREWLDLMSRNQGRRPL